MKLNSIYIFLSKGIITRMDLKDIEAFIFAFCIFLLTPPFYLWHTVSPLFFIGICCLLSLKNIVKSDTKNYILFIAFFFFYTYISIKNEQNFFGFVSILSICTLFITSPEFLIDVFKKYVYIFSITIIPSIIVFLLVYLLKINLPHITISSLNEFKTHDYFQYAFLVQPDNFLESILPRFCGYYDEPGVVGTLSGVILMSSGFNLRKKINIPVFIAGILSFSFAFYVMAIIYGLAFLSFKVKIWLIFASIGFVVLFSNNEVLDSYIFSRFTIEDGKIAGDNREADKTFKATYERFTQTNNYYFGVGAKAGQLFNFGGATYKDLIVAYGIIFFIYFVGVLTLYAFFDLQFKKEFFIFILILISILYQRPFITEYFYMFLIFISIPVLKSIVKQKDIIINENLKQ